MTGLMTAVSALALSLPTNALEKHPDGFYTRLIFTSLELPADQLQKLKVETLAKASSKELPLLRLAFRVVDTCPVTDGKCVIEPNSALYGAFNELVPSIARATSFEAIGGIFRCAVDYLEHKLKTQIQLKLCADKL